MSMDQPNDIYRAANRLLAEMDERMRKQVEVLLHEAKSGKKTDSSIVEIITQDDRMRKRLREELNLDESWLRSYSPPAGNPDSPSTKKFVCPIQGHSYVRRIQNVGEDPGQCPEHQVPLIPFDEKPSE